jgi:formate-dependent nitrite reductase cytochrome c552 subunit
MPAHQGSINLLATFGLSIIALIAGGFWVVSQTNQEPSPTNHPELNANEVAAVELHPVSIRQPSGPPRIDLGIKNADGEPITAACSTCHTTREPNRLSSASDSLNEFHGGSNFAHGNLNCLACHNPDDYDSLRLADGSRLEFTDVMTLCSQCHGTQRRDYDHGVHGGMNGYWDLTKGPRTRNNCVDCHDPHAPKFPMMRRTFFPQDRFLDNDH